MGQKRKTRAYTDSEKALVNYLKEKLQARAITKLPRDWHLKQLSTARIMLNGDKAPTLEDWKSCIEWAFNNKFWCDKVDHLAVIERLWPKYCLQKGGASNGNEKTGRTAPKRGSWNRGNGRQDPMPF